MPGAKVTQLEGPRSGTAFTVGAVGQAKFDNPKSPSNPISETPIIKTYIVESELTSIQHKNARLKELSTI